MSLDENTSIFQNIFLFMYFMLFFKKDGYITIGILNLSTFKQVHLVELHSVILECFSPTTKNRNIQ